MRLGDPERHQEGGPVKTETKDTWAPPGAGKSREERRLEPRKACRHLDFCCLASRTVKE